MASLGRAVVATVMLALAGCGSTVGDVVRQVAPAHDPTIIAVVQSGKLQIRSAATGRLIRTLGEHAGSISLTSDGRSIFYEASSGHLDPFGIDRVSTRGGKPTLVASGEDPAVSPDGRELAYASGSGDGIVVENLARHSTRTINLTSLVGPRASFSNTPGVVIWLSETHLVAIPPADGNALMTTPTTTAPAPPGSCTAYYDANKQCAIVIDLDAPDPAHVVTLSLPRQFAITAAGTGAKPDTLLVGGLGRGFNVARFSLTDTNAVLTGTVKILGQPLVVGFSPTGRQVLYLRNHGPVQLWMGELHSGSLWHE